MLQNAGEDTDEMYDDLFKKYGKVVFKSNDQKPPNVEAEDDAESLSCKPILLLLEYQSCDLDFYHLSICLFRASGTKQGRFSSLI